MQQEKRRQPWRIQGTWERSANPEACKDRQEEADIGKGDADEDKDNSVHT